MNAPAKLEIMPLLEFPRVDSPCDFNGLVVSCFRHNRLTPQAGDVIVAAHKIISKAEGRVVDLNTVIPSTQALDLAGKTQKDPALVEVILSESKRVVRAADGVIICEHRLGFICANAAVDRSNAGEHKVVLLPQDPDRSARNLCNALKAEFNADVAVLVADTHGRPWREGAAGLCIGLAGMEPFVDYRGQMDLYAYEMQTEVECVADELCAAGTLLMGQGAEGIPLVLVRGAHVQLTSQAPYAPLLRDPKRDLFR